MENRYDERFVVVLDIRQRNALTPKLRAEMGDAAGVLATAWNPFGRELPFERNRELNDQFASAMNERGKRMMGSYGEASDGSWREDGLFVYPVDHAEAVEICRQFDQNAVVLINPNGQAELVFHPDVLAD